DMLSLVTLFHRLNHIFKSNQFTAELESEIHQMSDFLHRKIYRKEGYRHKIHNSITYTNPLLENSGKLHELFLEFKNFNLDQFILLLVQGANPNQMDFVNGTPCHQAMSFKSTVILKFLLEYGGNPFLRNTRGISAFDFAKKFECVEHAQLIIKTFSQLKKVPAKIAIQKIDVLTFSNLVRTNIHLSDASTISTFLTTPNRLTLKTRDLIYQFFSKYFKTTNNMESFSEALSGKNKLVEWIAHDNRIIGFNFFELIYLPKFQHQITVHCQYSALDPQFRHLGIASLTAFRMIFALQEMLPHRASLIFYAISPMSCRLVKDFIFHPKYQSSHINAHVDELVEHTYGEGEKVNYHHQGLVCYVEDDVDRVKEPMHFSMENFLYWFMCGLINHQGKPKSASLVPRAVPCFYEVADVNLHVFLDMVSISFTEGMKHLENMAEALNSSGLILSKPTFHKITYPCARYSFFCNEVRESSNPSQQPHQSIRSKL
ncbi:MAG TPA: hypothetical protein VHM20_01175, partial [Gammaproteobacteria bacterium]|nr:hypothetical protein [Gammaproteobacteria bacterium]